MQFCAQFDSGILRMEGNHEGLDVGFQYTITVLITSFGMTSAQTQIGRVHISTHNNDSVHSGPIMTEGFTAMPA